MRRFLFWGVIFLFFSPINVISFNQEDILELLAPYKLQDRILNDWKLIDCRMRENVEIWFIFKNEKDTIFEIHLRAKDDKQMAYEKTKYYNILYKGKWISKEERTLLDHIVKLIKKNERGNITLEKWQVKPIPTNSTKNNKIINNLKKLLALSVIFWLFLVVILKRKKIFHLLNKK